MEADWNKSHCRFPWISEMEITYSFDYSSDVFEANSNIFLDTKAGIAIAKPRKYAVQ